MYTTPQKLRSEQDYKTEYSFIEKHSKGQAEIIIDQETGRVSHAIYRCPVNNFYRDRPNSSIAWSDITTKIDEIITDGPNHPDVTKNIEKIMDGTL